MGEAGSVAAPSETLQEEEQEALKKHWVQIQQSLRQRLITHDEFPWRLPSAASDSAQECLSYVGGVDVSYSKGGPLIACAALVVLQLRTLEVVYEDYCVSSLSTPYVPGFLAFREAPILLELLDKMKADAHPYYPQLLMVDGNGLLHPRGFGMASQLGVLANLPTIGIGKNLHQVDGLTRLGITQSLKANASCCEDIIPLTGSSGQILGMALRSTESSLKPIFISVGHRISLPSAVASVRMACKYRVPEPIRQADIRSRSQLQKHLQIP